MGRSREAFSDDQLFAGRLLCRQPGKGYRFTVDAVLLAHFVRPSPNDRLLDLGAGCGVVSLILAYRYPGLRLLALELQPRLAACARWNAERNGLDQRLKVVEGDGRRVSAFCRPGSFDGLVCNPPYHRSGSGRRNPGREEALARHEIALSLPAVVAVMAFALREGGKGTVVYPVSRLDALLAALQKRNMAAERLRLVHDLPARPARLVLLEAVKGGGAGRLTVLPPLVLRRRPDGGYSEEVAAFYQP